MRVLLDENLPYKLRQLFPESIEVITVGYRGWKGKENGELLRMAAVFNIAG
jgi:predicted nuclease of predicted toxin-antitoxin system